MPDLRVRSCFETYVCTQKKQLVIHGKSGWKEVLRLREIDQWKRDEVRHRVMNIDEMVKMVM